MSKKIEVIRIALNHRGIPLTQGIPEHIIEELKRNGYVLRKTKAWKKAEKKQREALPDTEQCTDM